MDDTAAVFEEEVKSLCGRAISEEKKVLLAYILVKGAFRLMADKVFSNTNLRPSAILIDHLDAARFMLANRLG